MTIEVDLRPCIGNLQSRILGSVEVVHAQELVFFRVPDGGTDGKEWQQWGIIGTHKNAKLCRTNRRISATEAKIIEPLIIAEIAKVRGSEVGTGRYAIHEEPQPELLDEDERANGDGGIVDEG